MKDVPYQVCASKRRTPIVTRLIIVGCLVLCGGLLWVRCEAHELSGRTHVRTPPRTTPGSTLPSPVPVPEPACPDYVPADCTELLPGMTLPQPVVGCFVVRQAGTTPYVHANINILAQGALYFVEAPGKTIDFQVQSLLVEQGGLLQAGSPSCPIGRTGGTLTFGLYGDDPSRQATVPNPPPGIQCLTNPGAEQACFPAERDPMQGTFYCTVSDSDDPCSATTPPTENPHNFLLEHYGNLNFDPTPFGYKTLSVSYGGSLRLFGSKGTALSSTAFDANDHCVVPAPEQSTLDAAEMQAWADLSGSSWARLDASQDVPEAGQTLLTLDRLVGDWAVGDAIVIGTTDWYPSHSELRTVRAVDTVSTPQGERTQLTVDALTYPHAAAMFDTDVLAQQYGATFTGPVHRKAADLRAAVGLLSRSIQIRSLGVAPQRQSTDPGFPEVTNCLYDGSGQTNPACSFGGHVMFRQGFREAQIQGVEFKQLGQGGRQGHYPVHFHLAKSTAYTQGKAFLKDSAVWDSMTRFVVLHGTHDVTVARNVGYLSVGHGYYLEDASEISNRLCHNLGVSARASLQEYFAAQADPKHWRGSPPAPSLAARYVPPILDGSNAVPELQPQPTLRTGSDTYMPVMFWLMNAYNEVVGNHAVGVHGFGSCYWLLGSGVSGPSALAHQFDGLAHYNSVAQGIQAPLLRFRGNACTTATYALPASAELPPANGELVGYTAVPNPYLTNADGSPKPVSALGANYARPVVQGNFQPIQPNAAGVTNCAQTGLTDNDLAPNTQACVTTVIDRFTTSFNWAEVNFGSIWFRPWFYLFLNSAETDQLFGGLTFVTAGSWVQVPPGYFSLVKNSLFVGTSQHGGSPYAKRSGPIFQVTQDDNLAEYAPCNGPKVTCNLEVEGTGYWRDNFQPKRLINIYDGPHFADGNLFVNVGAWECDPQPCQDKASGECELELPCGIYSSTRQPTPGDPEQPVDPHKMVVLDAGIGWKQPNGFYYPPAFTYRGATFFQTLPTGLPEPDPANPLNQCFSFGADNDYLRPVERPGGCRHNVIDRTRNYIAGNMIGLNGAPTIFRAQDNTLPVTPIDFSTILIDLDGSVTGAEGKLTGVSSAVPTTSLSRNAFFDAPAQSDECLSFGLQTSPYEFVTTIVAPLAASPATADPTSVDSTAWPQTPMVAIYRQWQTATDPATCGQVCDESDPSKYGCTRGTFMVGPNVGQAPYLTMAEPPGLNLSQQDGALYYIDTSTGSQQKVDCVRARTATMAPAPFVANTSYVVYNLFARNDSVVSYELFVGDGVNDLTAIKGRYVRVLPHMHPAGTPDFNSLVHDACDPTTGSGWCATLLVPTVQNGILTLALDQRGIADDFKVSERADYERCVPRDVCYFDGTQCQPCAQNPGQCIRQADFLPVDVQAMNQPDATGQGPLDVVCHDWATFASGTTTTTPGELSLVDCPSKGCLGFAFTLPADFNGNKTYQQVGAPLRQCFAESAWSDNALLPRESSGRLADPLCGVPRPLMSSDFCMVP